MAQPPDPQTWQQHLPVRGRRWMLDRSGDQFVVWDTYNAKQPAWFPATETGWLAAWNRHRSLERERRLVPLFVVLTVIVGLWMVFWVVATLLVPLGLRPEESDFLLGVVISELISVPAAILLTVFRRTRWWGLAVGFLGTGGAFLLFYAFSSP